MSLVKNLMSGIGNKIMFKTLFALLFSTGYAHRSNKKVDKKIAEMNARGTGLRVIDKDGNIKIIPMG